jgi:hypothetical protein
MALPPAARYVRALPSVKGLFGELYGTEELLTSVRAARGG